MAAITPRRSTRIPHTHTPKMSDRKKSLFQIDVDPPRESLTQHRRLPVVDSESDTDDCDLGIIATLDSSSGDELLDQNVPRTPRREPWHETRSHSKRLLKETNELKSFLKSPFTLNKYQTRYSCSEAKCTSTPVTPHLKHHPVTPSSTHSCASAHTTSSTSSRARKSLASLIADTESCSSSLKDLNFDTDSGSDSKENTPTKCTTRSGRKLKMTPKFASFKGVLKEQKRNVTSSPVKLPVVCLTKMDFAHFSPTHMLKTPHNNSENNSLPPKIGHNRDRRPVIEIAESPESCDGEISQKRLRDSSSTEAEPNAKHPRLDTSGSAPKARLSLFNLKELLSTKSFYGKSNPNLNTSMTKPIIEHAKIPTSTDSSHKHKQYASHSSRRKSRKPGQINLGVKHRIRKPKLNRSRMVMNQSGSYSKSANDSGLNNSALSNASVNNSTVASQNSSQELDNEKPDPFTKEQQTIANLLSQWTEDEEPEPIQPLAPREDLPCFNKTIIEETNVIFQPATATLVKSMDVTPQSEVILELGAKACQDVAMGEANHSDVHGAPRDGYLPVEGGYIVVNEAACPEISDEELTDLDAIERELKMLDEQIQRMAETNNIDAQAVLASSGLAPTTRADGEITAPVTSAEVCDGEESAKKLFPIFSRPNPGTTTPSTKASSEPTASSKKPILKSVSDQYVIDAGQKRFGATQCKECGVIYEIGDPQDEHDHLVHHNATDVLRFNGLKEERVVGTWGNSRCLLIRGTDTTAWKRVAALLDRVIHPQLGYPSALPQDRTYTYSAYLYIEKKQIIGCLVVEPKARAYKLISGDPDCCSVEDYPVKCGVSRIWTHTNHRRRGIAARLLDCARASLLYGSGLRLDEIAFSAPTAAGKAFASKYCGTENFYVYLE